MTRTIRDLMPNDLEFQMFVLDELTNDLIEQGSDVLKLTIGVAELPMPEIVFDRVVEKFRDPDFVRRVYPEGPVPETDFGVPHDERPAFCNDRCLEGIDRLRNYFTSSAADSPSREIHHAVTAANGGNA